METTGIQSAAEKEESLPGSATSKSCKVETSVLRPVCMDDTTDDDLPESYKRVRSFFPENEWSSDKILSIVLYIMALESGFSSDFNDDVTLTKHCYSFDLRKLERILPQFVINGLNNNVEYTFPLYLGSLAKCILRMKPVLGKLVVNFFSPGSLLCFSKILDVSSYVTDTELNKGKLKELSANCKNDLFCVMKSYYLYENDIKHACLLDLPFEIIVFIMMCISRRDFLNLCASCQYFHYNFRENENVGKYYDKKYGTANKRPFYSRSVCFQRL